jgi:hypothetical protein
MTYDWNADALTCFYLALRFKALAIGAVQFRTLPELYWQERHGVIP